MQTNAQASQRFHPAAPSHYFTQPCCTLLYLTVYTFRHRTETPRSRSSINRSPASYPTAKKCCTGPVHSAHPTQKVCATDIHQIITQILRVPYGSTTSYCRSHRSGIYLPRLAGLNRKVGIRDRVHTYLRRSPPPCRRRSAAGQPPP